MRRRGAGPVRNTIKNSFTASGGTTTTLASTILAVAVSSPDNTVTTQVENGCRIKAIHLSIDVCGLGASGVLQVTGFYLLKNPGANLTPPAVFSPGTSNEKRFIIKEWSAMTMRNQEGNPPYHWEGWIPIPKTHQRMATDDTWSIAMATSASTGHFSIKTVYKWES